MWANKLKHIAQFATMVLAAVIFVPATSSALAAVISSNVNLPAGSSPTSLAVSNFSDDIGTWVAVANADSTVSFFFNGRDIGPFTTDLPAYSVPKSVAFSPDGRTAYVANSFADTVSVIDVGSGMLMNTIQLAEDSWPWSVAFSPDGTKAYVANRHNGTISVITVASGAVARTITIPQVLATPISLAFSPDGLKVYVAIENYLDETVFEQFSSISVINVSTDTVSSTISLPLIGPQSVAFSPDGTKAYMANQNDTVSVINVATNTVTSSIALPDGSFPSSVAFSPDGTKAFVTNRETSKVSVITVATNTITNTISLAASSEPSSVAVSPDGSRLYVANRNTDSVSVVTLQITSAPLTLKAGATTAKSVALSWKKPTSLNGGVITDYVIQYRKKNTSTWLTFAHSASSATSRKVTGLKARTSYEFKVAARTIDGDSPHTAVVKKSTR